MQTWRTGIVTEVTLWFDWLYYKHHPSRNDRIKGQASSQLIIQPPAQPHHPIPPNPLPLWQSALGSVNPTPTNNQQHHPLSQNPPTQNTPPQKNPQFNFYTSNYPSPFSFLHSVIIISHFPQLLLANSSPPPIWSFWCMPYVCIDP